MTLLELVFVLSTCSASFSFLFFSVFACGDPVFSAPLVEDCPPLLAEWPRQCCPRSLILCVRAHVRALCSSPWSVWMPAPCCSDDGNTVVGSGIMRCESSNVVLPFQVGSGYLGSLERPYELSDGFSHLQNNIVGARTGVALNL